MRKTLLWGAILIGGYLVLKNFKGAVADTNSVATGSVNLVKAFQGR